MLTIQKIPQTAVLLIGVSFMLLVLGGFWAQRNATIESGPVADKIDLESGYSIFTGTMADMTWPEIEKAAANHALVLFPLGVIEEHGPHMACGADIYMAYLHCRLVQNELWKKNLSSVIAPPFYWGINTSTRNFPCSFDVKPETMKAMLSDIAANLKHWGFSDVYYLNSHGEAGHNLAILGSAKESRQTLGINIRAVMSDVMGRRFGLKGDENHILLVDFAPPSGAPVVSVPDFHAGAEETGDMVAHFPGLVQRQLIQTLKAPGVKESDYQYWGQDARKVTPLGYAGDPSAYNPNWSKKAIIAYCQAVARAIIEKHKKSDLIKNK